MAGDGEASSSSLSEGMYDAFLSFRGKDTRYRFTDHLYDKLVEKIKLKVFRDEPDLEMGDRVDSTLMEAIRRSRMFIVVISENYVSSSWCLMELEEMLKYSNNGIKRRIFPIFYDVEPAEVRYQISDKSKKAMEDHERRVGVEKVKAWKLALSTLCRLSGEHIVENREYETKVIGEIAEAVSAKHREIKQVLDIFGSHFKAVESILNLQSRNTLGMVGVYEEDAKIDATTFAFELYYKIKYKFQAASFLRDVSNQLWGNNANGLENLKKELLSDMGVEESKKQKLQHRRVLVVLEGVDSKEHLQLLLGQQGIRDWFARDNGSRIIITTEDKNLFQRSPVMMMNGAQLETYCIREGGIIDGNRGSFAMMEEKVVEMEKDYSGKVMNNQLKEEGSAGNVDSMVGMGGLGKTTTIAPKVNNNSSKTLQPQDNGKS
ncbi:hypothetical protein PIB30_068444 [Stylosanthes scabra]|uniref:TIR domain-containing protein n=1 Tax=Stylosanthes scabra TaxID=79078 RepID=A0ABU6RNP0_9FABA|nr:hypothetical protein [Stylosanthes scabra]